MKITKKQLKHIIKEEKSRLLREQWDDIDTGSPLIEFARAYRGLGDAVASQVDAVVGAYITRGDFTETVHEQNPNAIDMAMDRLGRVLRYGDLGGEGEMILEALEAAQTINLQGDEDDIKNEGTSLEDMPDAWRQVLGKCLKDTK